MQIHTCYPEPYKAPHQLSGLPQTSSSTIHTSIGFFTRYPDLCRPSHPLSQPRQNFSFIIRAYIEPFEVPYLLSAPLESSSLFYLDLFPHLYKATPFFIRTFIEFFIRYPGLYGASLVLCGPLCRFSSVIRNSIKFLISYPEIYRYPYPLSEPLWSSTSFIRTFLGFFIQHPFLYRAPHILSGTLYPLSGPKQNYLSVIRTLIKLLIHHPDLYESSHPLSVPPLRSFSVIWTSMELIIHYIQNPSSIIQSSIEVFMRYPDFYRASHPLSGTLH